MGGPSAQTEGAVATGSAPQERMTRRMTLLAASVGFFMVILATTAINVALGSIREEFGAGVSGLQWVVNGYTLVFAGLLLTAGTLGDRFGPRRVFLAGFAVFGGASALCALAPSLPVLVGCQALAGLGAALLVPSSLALIGRVFADPTDRAGAIGVWAAAGGTAIAAGPLAGGLLVDVSGWRTVFLVNVVAGVAGLCVALRYIAPTRPSAEGSGLDLAGQGLGIAALCALTFALIEGGARGWGSPLILGASGIAVAAAVAFLAVEGRRRRPMLPLSLFASPTFSATASVGLLLNFAYYGQVFLFSLYFQQERGYSPLVTGLAFLPMTATVVLANLLCGRIVARWGERATMAVGQALCGSGLLSLILVGEGTGYPALFCLLVAVGFGAGLVVPPMTAALLGTVEANRVGIASGVLNASRQMGGVLGVALFGALVSASPAFVEGMHVSLAVAGGGLFVGCALALIFVRRAAKPTVSEARAGAKEGSRPNLKAVKRGATDVRKSANPGAGEEDRK